MLRDPAPYADFVRGKNAFKPFKPGGLDGDANDEEEGDSGFDVLGGQILTVPPGFERGLFGPGPDAAAPPAPATPVRAANPVTVKETVSIGEILADTDDQWWFKELPVKKPAHQLSQAHSAGHQAEIMETLGSSFVSPRPSPTPSLNTSLTPSHPHHSLYDRWRRSRRRSSICSPCWQSGGGEGRRRSPRKGRVRPATATKGSHRRGGTATVGGFH